MADADLRLRAAAVADNRTAGASELALELTAILEDALARGRAAVVEVTRIVCRGQPAMAPLWNLSAVALGELEAPGRFARLTAELARAPRALERAAMVALAEGLASAGGDHGVHPQGSSTGVPLTRESQGSDSSQGSSTEVPLTTEPQGSSTGVPLSGGSHGSAAAVLRFQGSQGSPRGRSARVLTLSYSASVARVLHAIAKTRAIEVVCAESRPACEGVRMRDALAAAGARASLVIDAEITTHLPGAAAVVVGADAVAARSWINKAGTFGLAAAAWFSGVPVYVLASRDKAQAAVLEPLMRPLPPTFESIPAHLATLFLTDAGPVTPDDLPQVAERLAADAARLAALLR